MGDNTKELYIGDVRAYCFETYIGKFQMKTYASSEKEAKRNFEYRLKKKAQKLPSAKIRIEGSIRKS